MKRLPGFVLAALFCGNAVASPDDFRCFKSIDQKKPIRLQFVFATENPDRGYVIYEHGSGKIPVVDLGAKATATVKDRPSEFSAQWEEVTSDGSGGRYTIVSQGARVSDFRYTRKKDGKVFHFEEDMEASGDDGCTWNKF
jgi:hypothetical protein